MQNLGFGQQQQQPGNVFAWIDELQGTLPKTTPWALAVVGSMSGFFYAGRHGAEDYTLLLVAGGFLGGLLFLKAVAFLLKAFIALAVIGIIALILLWLLGYQTAHHHPAPPSQNTALPLSKIS